LKKAVRRAKDARVKSWLRRLLQHGEVATGTSTPPPAAGRTEEGA
jgi:hypothetical protein